MKRNYSLAWKTFALGLAITFTGCTELAQRHLGGARHGDDLADGPPKPAPALHIPNPPANARGASDGNVQQATFIPNRDQPNPQMMQHPLRVLYQRAAQTHAGMDAYIYRLRRRETANGRKMPEELLRVELRRDPYSVHLKWLGVESKGREVVYVKGSYNNQMQILLAANDAFPFSPAGIRWSIAADDPKALAKSRYPITETGLGSLVERFGQIVAGVEKGDAKVGTLKYLGKVKREEFDAPVEAAHQIVPASTDPNLPKGGQRWWYFDATSGLPVLIITTDASDEVVEYYCHDHIQAVRLDDDDFNPDRLWKR